MSEGIFIPDGNKELQEDLSAIAGLFSRTARWVSPETFRRLPIWCPEIARGQPLYDAKWTRRYTNTKKLNNIKSEKFEGNVAALKALVAALDVAKPKPDNWTVCHVWGYDDRAFAERSLIVQDPKYYSCIANMVWVPTSLKSFTDALPEVKTLLRTCAYYLYGWACEHPSVALEAQKIRSGVLPSHYPESWPSKQKPNILPLGTSPYSHRIEAEIGRRKTRWNACLTNPTLMHYPREQVRDVLCFWKVTL